MKKGKIILFVIGLLLIVVPYFINIYNILRLVAVALGIILLTISLTIKKGPRNYWLIFYLPIILLLLTYSVDYFKTYTFNLKPIFVFENKINQDLSIYNSLLYRVYRCGNNYIFDNNYQKNFPCQTSLVEDININTLLRDAKESYKNYKYDIIKVTGKIGKIIGNSQIEFPEYTEEVDNINGYVKFNQNSKLIVNLKDIDLSKYKVYDYLTVVGLLESYNKDTNELILTNAIIETNGLYASYKIEVIENSNCSNEYNEYAPNVYSRCLSNIYLDYDFDKYELSYALKDNRITLEELIKYGEKQAIGDNTLYEMEQFKVLFCRNQKKFLMSKQESIDYSICDEK